MAQYEDLFHSNTEGVTPEKSPVNPNVIPKEITGDSAVDVESPVLTNQDIAPSPPTRIMPPQPYKKTSKMNFNITAVDTTPLETPHLPKAETKFKGKGDFDVPGVDTTIIYDDLPSDEDSAILSGGDSIKNLLEPSTRIIEDITTYIKGQNITPVSRTPELSFSKEQYFFDAQDQAYILNEEQIGDIYRIILSLNSSEIFSKTVKKSHVLQQHQKKMMEALETRTEYFTQSIPTHINPFSITFICILLHTKSHERCRAREIC